MTRRMIFKAPRFHLWAHHDVTSDVVNSWFVFHVGCIREGRSVLSRKQMGCLPLCGNSFDLTRSSAHGRAAAVDFTDFASAIRARLSGLLICGECGSAFCGRTQRGKYSSYTCIGNDRRRTEQLPLTESVSAISMAVQTVPIPVSRQRDLFSSTEHIRPQEELATLIARLSNRMGPQSVSVLRIQADPRPEHAILPAPVIASADSTVRAPQSEHLLQRLTEPDPDAMLNTERTLPRALRLLATPQQIAGRDSDQRAPERISVLGQPNRIIELHGPERIQTAWWTDAPCHRDYYRAVIEASGQLWIFRDLLTGGWFLQGLFD